MFTIYSNNLTELNKERNAKSTEKVLVPVEGK